MNSITSANANDPSKQLYVEVILPFPLPKTFTYKVLDEMVIEVKKGVRVEVPFGKNKIYAGIIADLHYNQPEGYQPKAIYTVLDKDAIVNEPQLKLWEWMARYYCSSLGEVMNVALPHGLKLASETRLTLSSLFDNNMQLLDDKEYLIAEALTIRDEITISEAQKILNQQKIYGVIQSLLQKNVILLREEVQERYKPKQVTCVRLQEPYASNFELLSEAFDKIKRAERQTEALMAYVQLSRQMDLVLAQKLYDTAKIDSTVLKAMEKKGIFEIYKKEVSRIADYDGGLDADNSLSEAQIVALSQIKTHFEEKNVVLLHGITGSGKTQLYVELIKETMAKGGQILYLLPEIALTAQIISRLQKIFGNDIAVYHSKFNDQERVELWHTASAGKPIILGARSSLFLPFHNLQLVIIDEEHDPSYKQFDPAPRYNARDSAIYLAQLYGAKTLLGSATPSIETYYNAKSKYGLVELNERYGGIELPEIQLVDLQKEAKERKEQFQYSRVLIEAIQTALDKEEQIILFQNRRGYAPVLRCNTCSWVQECKNCDVSLTYHKYSNNLHCHYCGYEIPIPKECPACGTKGLTLKGFGTERIEDDVQIYVPKARIGRMDLDSVRSKHAHANIINDFEEKRLDILVGTQMVTKGLDFDNVAIVGIMNADTLFYFPDFRANERAFQLITQVSGRAGRRNKQGKVILQTYNLKHPIIKDAQNGDYDTFYKREIKERKSFEYPPFTRLIRIVIQHKKPEIATKAAQMLFKLLDSKLRSQKVIGPSEPMVARVRNYYLKEILLKLDKDANKIQYAKNLITEGISHINAQQGFSTVFFNIDVDPY